MKADLHAHSCHSGYARHFEWLRARECYSTPEAVYRMARARGMDLVCITDHDSIGGCLEYLDRHPDAADFIMGEEISCQVPDAPGLRVHLGAIGITEPAHHEAQRLRGNLFDTAAYLRGQGIFTVVNHLFMFFDDQMAIETYVRRALEASPGIETRNGAMLATHNDLIAAIAWSVRGAGVTPVAVGGSDAHMLRYVGTTYTETAGSTREEFLEHLRAGRTRVGGAHGGYGRLFTEIYGTIGNHWRGLLGLERHDLLWQERLTSGICSALLLPFQFIPGIVAWHLKRDEEARIERCRRWWFDEATRTSLAAGPSCP